MTRRQQTMPEQLKIKATTDIDLQATDEARTAENQGNHWYRLTGNRRCQNSWKSRQPLISTYRQQTMPEQLKIKETTYIDLQATDDTRTAENQGNHWYRLTGNRRSQNSWKSRQPLNIDLHATDDDRTVENEGNHWYRLTGNRRYHNCWKSRHPLISTYRQQTMPEELKIKASTVIDLQATDDARTAENQGNHWYRLTGKRRWQNRWKSRQPLISTHRQQTMPEQLKIKATTDIDLQATDDARTAENQGNHWYRLTGNRRWQNSWKSRQPLISTHRQQTMPEQLKIKATTDIDLTWLNASQMFVCWLNYNFWTMRDRDLIFDMHTQLKQPLQWPCDFDHESICYDNGLFLPGVQPSISVTL